MADPTFKGASNYGLAVYGTWDISFTAIKKRRTRAAETAILISQIFAFCHHANIAEEIIKRAAEAVNGDSIEGKDVSLPLQLLQLDQQGGWNPMFFRKGIRPFNF